MSRKVNIGLIQMQSTQDVSKNLKKGLENIKKIAQKGAQIIALPELFVGPYFCQTREKKFFDLAEPLPGPTLEALCKIAAQTETVIITSIYEKTAAKKYYNTAVVIDADGKMVGKYRKIHIPNDPQHGYDEAYYFAPGDLGVRVFETRYAKVAPQICYDQWFPEGARAAGLKGAEILFFPTAIGWPTSQRDRWLNKAENNMWQVTQISHGIDNNCFIASVNRVKLEDTLNFWGTSFVSDPYGQIVKEAPKNKETNLIATIDLDLIQRKVADWPFHSDYNKVITKIK